MVRETKLLHARLRHLPVLGRAVLGSGTERRLSTVLDVWAGGAGAGELDRKAVIFGGVLVLPASARWGVIAGLTSLVVTRCFAERCGAVPISPPKQQTVISLLVTVSQFICYHIRRVPNTIR